MNSLKCLAEHTEIVGDERRVRLDKTVGRLEMHGLQTLV